MNTATLRKPLQQDIEEAVAGYVDCGFGVINGLLSSDEIDPLVRESERLWRRYVRGGAGNLRFGVRMDQSGETVIDSIDPVGDVSETFAALNRDQRLVSIAESGLGEAVTVMKEKLIYRWPGSQGFGPHRDQEYTTPKSGVPGKEVLTVSIALDRATRASGPTEFFPVLRNRPTAAPAGEPRDVDERELHGVTSCMPETKPGDVILFDGQVPHRSESNRSDLCRRVYMISYVPARYPDARRNFYAGRISEQGEMRRDLVEGSIFYE